MESVAAQPARFGKYALLNRIGSGGMAEVFLAKTEGIEGFERKVALKRIYSELTAHDEFVRSFIHEARIGGMLYHHNVVQTLDFGKVDGIYFIALEYIEGTQLGAVLAQCKHKHVRLPAGVFLQLALQICEGLDYIHHATIEGEGLKLVHRDIKPSNMLITSQGLVKISDFGVVKAESALDSRTRVGSVKGTIGYMSPEQARGEPIGPAADLFALGAMLYEMVTAKRLYGQGEDWLILKRVRDSEYQEPLEVVDAAVPGLSAVLTRLLEPDPKARFAAALEVSDALRALPVKAADRSEVVAFMRGLGLLDNAPRDSGRQNAQLRLEDATELDLVPDDQATVALARMPGLASAHTAVLDPRRAARGPVQTPVSVPTYRPSPVPRGLSPTVRVGLLWGLVTVLGLGAGLGTFLLVDAQLGAQHRDPDPASPALEPRPGRSSETVPALPSSAQAPVWWSLHIDPPGALVRINGVAVTSQSPADVPVRAGQEIQVELEGYRPWIQRVPADRPLVEQVLDIHLEPLPLEPLPEPPPTRESL